MVITNKSISAFKIFLEDAFFFRNHNFFREVTKDTFFLLIETLGF